MHGPPPPPPPQALPLRGGLRCRPPFACASAHGTCARGRDAACGWLGWGWVLHAPSHFPLCCLLRRPLLNCGPCPLAHPHTCRPRLASATALASPYSFCSAVTTVVAKIKQGSVVILMLRSSEGLATALLAAAKVGRQIQMLESLPLHACEKSSDYEAINQSRGAESASRPA